MRSQGRLWSCSGVGPHARLQHANLARFKSFYFHILRCWNQLHRGSISINFVLPLSESDALLPGKTTVTGGTVLDRILELDHYGEREAASVRTTLMPWHVLVFCQVFWRPDSTDYSPFSPLLGCGRRSQCPAVPARSKYYTQGFEA